MLFETGCHVNVYRGIPKVMEYMKEAQECVPDTVESIKHESQILVQSFPELYAPKTFENMHKVMSFPIDE